jgi:hypothetical protein
VSVSRDFATLEHLAFSRTRRTSGDFDCHAVLHCTPACSRRCAGPNRSLPGTKSRRSRRSGLSVCPHCSPDLLTARECSAPEPKSCGVARGPSRLGMLRFSLCTGIAFLNSKSFVAHHGGRNLPQQCHEHASCAGAASFVEYGRSVRSVTNGSQCRNTSSLE